MEGSGKLYAPQGAPLSSPHAEPMAPAALPKTSEADTDTLSDSLVLVAVIGLIAGGWVLQRSHRQHR